MYLPDDWVIYCVIYLRIFSAARLYNDYFSQQAISVVDNVLTQFIGRITAQVQQLTSFLVHSYHKYMVGLRVVVETDDHFAMDEDYLTRDEFSLHKIIVAASNVGKVSEFCILNLLYPSE